MPTLLPPPPLASASVVFFGHYGEVSALAGQRGLSRQTLYREAHAVVRAVQDAQDEPTRHALRQQLADLQDRVTTLQRQLDHTVRADADQLAEFAATAQALGVSLSAARTLLAVLIGPATPSVATLGRLTQQAARQASAVLEVLDQHSRAKARQLAADEIFVGRKPVLMTVEQDSLCWLGGRLAPSRDAPEWAQEFRQLPAATQVTRDGGQGLRKGLEQVNRERQRAGQPLVDDQEDHFHLLQRGRRALRTARAQAARALSRAEKAQQALQRTRRQGRPPAGHGRAAHLRWQQAEQAFDRWTAQEQAFTRLREALRLFTPDGQLNTRVRAEAEAQAAAAALSGPDAVRLRRRLARPGVFTFLERVQEQLTALPIPVAVRQLLVRVEGLRRRPELLRAEGPSAGALRGLVLATAVLVSLLGEAGQQAVAAVRAVLGGAWRSSSLVEGLNSVLRMQQARQKRLTQGLLDLKRLHWNLHRFRAGQRKGQSPYGKLGLILPKGGWWDLLNIPPEQLQEQLSALNAVA